MTSFVDAGGKLALVDDDDTDALMVSGPLRRAGIEIVRVEGHMSSVDQLIEQLTAKSATATLCDNRLSAGGLAEFSGALAAATLFESGLPCVLMTTYIDTDAGATIRRYRAKIPALLRRTDARDPETLIRAIRRCESELAGEVAPDRRGRRTIISIRNVVHIDSERYVDAMIPAWSPYEAIRLPVSLLPVSTQAAPDRELLGVRFSAVVNTSADSDPEIFIDDAQQIDMDDADSEWQIV